MAIETVVAGATAAISGGTALNILGGIAGGVGGFLSAQEEWEKDVSDTEYQLSTSENALSQLEADLNLEKEQEKLAKRNTSVAADAGFRDTMGSVLAAQPGQASQYRSALLGNEAALGKQAAGMGASGFKDTGTVAEVQEASREIATAETDAMKESIETGRTQAVQGAARARNVANSRYAVDQFAPDSAYMTLFNLRKEGAELTRDYYQTTLDDLNSPWTILGRAAGGVLSGAASWMNLF
jgi:hypothetical protein